MYEIRKTKSWIFDDIDDIDNIFQGCSLVHECRTSILSEHPTLEDAEKSLEQYASKASVIEDSIQDVIEYYIVEVWDDTDGFYAFSDPLIYAKDNFDEVR